MGLYVCVVVVFGIALFSDGVVCRVHWVRSAPALNFLRRRIQLALKQLIDVTEVAFERLYGNQENTSPVVSFTSTSLPALGAKWRHFYRNQNRVSFFKNWYKTKDCVRNYGKTKPFLQFSTACQREASKSSLV